MAGCILVRSRAQSPTLMHRYGSLGGQAPRPLCHRFIGSTADLRDCNDAIFQGSVGEASRGTEYLPQGRERPMSVVGHMIGIGRILSRPRVSLVAR
jgi:hypothetical protein